MDGIKPTLSDADLKDDSSSTSEPVLVDLLHPAEQLDEPTPRIAPITPPRHGIPESNVEMVPAPPPPQLSVSVADAPADQTTVKDLAPAAAPVMMPSQVTMVQGRRGANRKPALIGLIIVFVLLAGGAAAWYYFTHRTSPTTNNQTTSLALTATAPSKLVQQNSAGPMTSGATTNAAPTFSVTLPTKATTGSASAEVEVEPFSTAFTGTPTASGQPVSANGGDLVLPVTLTTALPDGSYHWQARTRVGADSSAWVTSSAAGATTPDFIISTVLPAAPTLAQVSSGKVSGTTATTTENQPQLSGNTAPNSTLSITVTPDNITLTPTVAADGSWTATPTQQLANGAHTITIVTTDSAGNQSKASYTLNINPPAAAAPAASASTSKLAPTGDQTSLPTLLAILAGATSVIALVFLRRYDRR